MCLYCGHQYGTKAWKNLTGRENHQLRNVMCAKGQQINPSLLVQVDKRSDVLLPKAFQPQFSVWLTVHQQQAVFNRLLAPACGED